MMRRPPRSRRSATLLPYTSLFRSYCRVLALGALGGVSRGHPCRRGATGGRHSSPDRGSAVTNRSPKLYWRPHVTRLLIRIAPALAHVDCKDRKSTRLNSSH